MNRSPFPKFIDKIKMIGPFEIDEFAFIVAGVAVMLIAGFMFTINVALAIVLGLFLGLFIALIIKGVKVKFSEGYIYHLLYIKGIRHPMHDNPTARVKHIEYYRKNLKAIPLGFVKTLVE